MPNAVRALVLAVAVWVAGPAIAMAETIVLVQGYLGSAGSWRSSGVGPILHGAGWRDGGHLSMHQGGVIEAPSGQPGNRRFMTIDLMTEAPIMVQADALGAYVAHIRRKSPGERIVLVGHSAGGVVARLFMVRQPQ
ncbi:MAG: hypothetical protein ABL908_09200, partial [Hyphomicrobium sp.]